MIMKVGVLGFPVSLPEYFIFFPREVCGLRVFSSNCSFFYKVVLLLSSAACDEVEVEEAVEEEEEMREEGIYIF